MSYRKLKVEVHKQKQYILQLFLNKGRNANQAAEIVNCVYGPATVLANYGQFLFLDYF